MTAFFSNRLSKNDSQQVRVSTSVSTATYHDGLVYDNTDDTAPDKLGVNYSGTPAFYNAGIAFDSDGLMLVVDASGGLPTDTVWISGLPVSWAESRLCVDANGSVSYVHQATPFTAMGAVAVDTGSGPAPDKFRVTDIGDTRVTDGGDSRVYV